MKVVWTELAFEHLDSIREYIAVDNKFYAKMFTEKIVMQTRKLSEFPRMGRVVPEFINNPVETRELIYRDYRIIYIIKGEEVQIVAVIHGSRQLD